MKKTVVKIFSGLFPGAVTRFAYDQLTNPQIKKLRQHELDVLNRADQGTIEFKGFSIRTYYWNGEGKEILLIHGWEGQAGNFSDLVEKLIDAGFSVRAFDGPSHGFSSRGSTSLFEFTELVGVIIRKYNIKNLISHSFGGVATTYSLYSDQNLEIDKYLLLTTPDRFVERIEDVSAQTGISDKVKNKLISRLESELEVEVGSLNVSDFVKKVNVREALIVHDKDDRVIPIERSKNVCKNWSSCRFEEIDGTGHFRILRNNYVHEIVLRFFSQ